MDVWEIIEKMQQALTTLNHNSTTMQVDVAVLKDQVSLILWFVKCIGVTMIGLFLTQVWKIVTLRKNDKK